MSDKYFLVIGHDANRTGAPTSLLNFIKWMRKNTDYLPVIVLGDGGELLESYKELGEVIIWKKSFFKPLSIKYRLINKIRGVFNLPKRDWNRIEFYEFLGARKIDFCFNNTIINGHILKEIISKIQIPVITRIPELEATIRYHELSKLASTTFNFSNHIVAVSQAVKDNLIKNHQITEEKISIVNGAVSKRQSVSVSVNLRQNLGLKENTIIICGCGTLDWRKGSDLFIQIAKRVLGSNLLLPVCFVWIGGGKYSKEMIEIQYDIENLGLEKEVFFIGQVDFPEHYFEESDIFLLTSREDPFPLVMIEAAFHGLPVVCFDKSGGAPEFVDENIGSVVPYMDVDLAAKELLSLINNKDSLLTKSNKSKLKASNFESEILGKEIYNVVSQVISN